MGLISFYYLIGRRIAKVNADNLTRNHLHKINKQNVPFVLLMAIIVISSVNLFSNSMISHSNALPSFSSLAISVDWVHFVAVSIWIGGLFYFSTLILRGTKLSTEFGKRDINSNNENSMLLEGIRKSYYISILLTYFSYIAIVSLGIIGITGLYMGLVHLQSLDAIFNTQYGNILIIKLSLAFPMVFLGRYNQLKIQKYLTLAKKFMKIDHTSNHDKIDVLTKHHEKKLIFFKQISKSIKVESLLGISVLIAASFLSVTSPPSLATTDQNPNTVGKDDGAIYLNNNPFNQYFFVLVIILSVVILMLSITNFRNNHKKISEIFEQT
jgi:putative copper export protein